MLAEKKELGESRRRIKFRKRERRKIVHILNKQK